MGNQHSKKKPTKERKSLRWIPPEDCLIKINVDGAFMNNGDASIVVVIRNSEGTVLLSAWRVLSHAVNAEEVELMACREGVALAVEWTPMHAIFESDCLSALQLLSKQGEQRSSSMFLVKEICDTARRMTSLRFHHVKRDQNVVAHELAQFAKRLFHSAVWRNRAPTSVEQIVAHERNFVR
jgi:hypothetical protein